MYQQAKDDETSNMASATHGYASQHLKIKASGMRPKSLLVQLTRLHCANA